MNDKNDTIKTSLQITKRQFKRMPTLDTYIFKEFIIIFICCTLAFCLLFFASNMINKLGDFLSTNANGFTIAYYFLLLLPTDIMFVLPMALLLSTMYCMAKLGMNNEITALRASGISLIRCGLAIYFVGLVVTGVSFWFQRSLAPNTNYEAMMLLKIAQNPEYFQLNSRMLMYRSPDNRRTWLVKWFVTPNEQQGIQLKHYAKNGQLDMELYSKTSDYSPQTGWQFYDADIVTYKEVPLIEDYSNENAGQIKMVTMPITTHYAVIDNKDPIFKEFGDITETPNDILNELKNTNQLTTSDIERKLVLAQNLAPKTAAQLETELYNRMAFPWVCLMAVFLAVPLAGSNERKGVMIAVVSAIVVVVFYEILQQVFVVLGNSGYLPPIVAGTTPTIALAVYIWFTIIRN